jgi:hypothetical protein
MRYAFRTLILACALVALSVPVFSVTHSVSACSLDDCTTSVTGSGMIDSYFSPLEVNAPTIVCDEVRLNGEHHGGNYYSGCDLTFTTLDPRGNNTGFLVSVASGGFWNSLAYDSATGKFVNIPAGNLSFAEADATLTHCYGLFPGLDCEHVKAVTGYYGRTLSSSSSLPVLVACPTNATGKGRWANHVRLNLTVPDAGVGLIFGAEALNWTGDFTVTLSEGPNIAYTGTYGCRSAASS